MATTKVTIQAKDFAKALETAAQLINSKNALPILGDVLLRYRRGTGWTMTSSNSEAWLTFSLPQMTLIENKVDGRNVHPDEAAFCIPAADARPAFSRLDIFVQVYSLVFFHSFSVWSFPVTNILLFPQLVPYY